MVEEFKKESEEPLKEAASEVTPQGIKETSEESEKVEEASKESEETFEETKKPEESSEETGETSEETEKASEEVKDVKDSSEESEKSEDSSTESKSSAKEQTPAGITDEELSRVFESIPRKSKVALNRVESKMNNVKGAKSSPSWYPWVFSLIMIVGLVWAVVYYLTGNYPIPNIGAWNLCISFVTILVGFVMTMAWK